METTAPHSHICFGSLCCADHGRENAERAEIAVVQEREDIGAEREGPAEVVAASGEQAVSGDGKMEPAAKREELTIDVMGESVEPALGVPRSLPPAPLRGSWNRTGANYEEARRRLMQAPAAPDLAEKGWKKVPPSKRRVTRIAAPTRAPSGAPVDYRHTRVISTQWSTSRVEQTVIARAAAPLGARDDRREPRVSAPSRALPDEPRVSAQLSEPVPRPVRVAAPNRATLDHNFVARAPAPSSPPLVICNDTASGLPPGAAKSLAKAKAKAPRRAAKPLRTPKAKKSGANSRQLTAPPTPKSKLWAPLVVVGFCCVVGLFTIALVIKLQHAHGP